MMQEWEAHDKWGADAGGSNLAAETRMGYMVDLAAYSPFTRRIIGCATQVHTLLSSDFSEVIYQRALGSERA